VRRPHRWDQWWWLNQDTHCPWFRNVGDEKDFQPPFLHSFFELCPFPWPWPAAIVAGVNVYVTLPSALVVGVTLLQPRKYVVPFELATLKRGEPPWHWLAFASVNDADENVWPSRPVIDAPAEAFVVVVRQPCPRVRQTAFA
jgi:hypothetical protein